MKKLGVFLLVLLTLAGCEKKEEVCDVNAGMICVNEETNEYILEDNAVLTVSVQSEEYGNALAELWDKTYPSHQGALNIVVVESMDGKSWMDLAPDVGLLWGSEAARLNEWLLPMEALVEEEIKPGLLLQYGESANANQFVYVPMSGYGWVFSYNRSMLQELGVDLTDANENGLPDGFDTFEGISQWSSSLTDSLVYRDQVVNNIFQFNFDEPSLAMMWLSAAGFKPFESMEAEIPGWDSEVFLAALTDLKALGQMRWVLGEDEQILEENTDRQQSSEWGSEFYLSSADSVFSMVGTWMYYDEYESLNEEDFGFSIMPSLNGYTIHPYTMSAGYVIRKDTAYPNACYQLMRLIRSDEGLQIYAENANEPLLYNYNETRFTEDEEGKEIAQEPLNLTFRNENLQEISRAMMEGTEESMVAFALEPSVRGWDMIEDCEIYYYLRRVFAQTISISAARGRIVEATNAWMKPYLPEIEEEAE